MHAPRIRSFEGLCKKGLLESKNNRLQPNLFIMKRPFHYWAHSLGISSILILPITALPDQRANLNCGCFQSESTATPIGENVRCLGFLCLPQGIRGELLQL